MSINASNIKNRRVSSYLNNNEIDIFINVEKKDVKKKIHFFGEYFSVIDEYNPELFINNNIFNFQKYFIPEIDGEYNIKIILSKDLGNCRYMFENCEKILFINLKISNTKNIIQYVKEIYPKNFWKKSKNNSCYYVLYIIF